MGPSQPGFPPTALAADLRDAWKLLSEALAKGLLDPEELKETTKQLLQPDFGGFVSEALSLVPHWENPEELKISLHDRNCLCSRVGLAELLGQWQVHHT